VADFSWFLLKQVTKGMTLPTQKWSNMFSGRCSARYRSGTRDNSYYAHTQRAHN
jgi:hypothetical protein